jgi:hypothetical protein
LIRDARAVSVGGNCDQSMATLYNAVVNAYVRMYAWQNSGGVLNITGAIPDSPVLWAYRVTGGPP